VEITEIRIKLMEERETNNERLQAFCSVTFDDMFVVRDLKIIEGTKGSFVAMPSRKLTDRCTGCGCKNHLRARFCNQCGGKLNEDRANRDHDGRIKLHADIAHPINSNCREFIQGSIIKAFHEEQEKAKLPGYVCRYDDIDAGEIGDSYADVIDGLGVRDRRDTYRRHAAHEPRGAHTGYRQHVKDEAVVASNDGMHKFGAGIVE
jgi:stage V sporulation protein G